MKKRLIPIIALSLLTFGMTSTTLASCGEVAQGPKGDKGETGEPGHTPVVEIKDGYWYIDGKNTNIKATGEDGSDGEDGITPTISIGKDGYWYINGEKTNIKASGEDGEDGSDGNKGEVGDQAYSNIINYCEGIKVTPNKGSYLVNEDVTFKITLEEKYLFESFLVNNEEFIDKLTKISDSEFTLTTKMVEGGLVVTPKAITIKSYTHLESAFIEEGFKCGSSEVDVKEYVLDGKNAIIISEWNDAYFYNNITFKNVIFEAGITFNAKNIKENGATIRFENCTFKGAKSLEHIIDITNNNVLHKFDRYEKVRPGLCLGIETQQAGEYANKVKVEVIDCEFIGENDNTLPRKVGYNKNNINLPEKGYSHGLAINAHGGDGQLIGDILVENSSFSGHRGQAIQLSGLSSNINIKNTQINSWGVNKEGKGSAIRGIKIKDKAASLNLDNVYFGLKHENTEKISQVYINDDPNLSIKKDIGNFNGTLNISNDGKIQSEYVSTEKEVIKKFEFKDPKEAHDEFCPGNLNGVCDGENEGHKAFVDNFVVSDGKVSLKGNKMDFRHTEIKENTKYEISFDFKINKDAFTPCDMKVENKIGLFPQENVESNMPSVKNILAFSGGETNQWDQVLGGIAKNLDNKMVIFVTQPNSTNVFKEIKEINTDEVNFNFTYESTSKGFITYVTLKAGETTVIGSSDINENINNIPSFYQQVYYPQSTHSDVGYGELSNYIFTSTKLYK